MNPIIRLKEVICTAYLKLKILGRMNTIIETLETGFGSVLRRIDKMDQATQDAINAVKKAVTDGTTELAQVITDEGTDIKNKFDAVISQLPSTTDPAIAQQLNDLAGAVSNSFQSLKSGVQNLSDNVAATGGTGSGTGTTP